MAGLMSPIARPVRPIIHSRPIVGVEKGIFSVMNAVILRPLPFDSPAAYHT